MTHETKKRVKADAFAEMRRTALACMMAVVGTDIEDTWDGVMNAKAKVGKYGDESERAAFDMAQDKWMHAYLEEWTCEKVRAAEALLEHEKDAEHEEALAAKRA